MKQTTPLMKTHWINDMTKVLMLSLCLILAACSTSKEKIFKEDMPTMKEIYTDKFHHLDVSQQLVIERKLEHTVEPNRAVISSSSVASSYKELQKQFPKAPNPIMLMLIFPHLTQSGTPVPEYNTYFRFYKNDHFTVSNNPFNRTSSGGE